MRKLLLFIPAFALMFACNKNGNKTACGIHVCNDVFMNITVVFADKTGKLIFITNYSAVNQRTNLPLQHEGLNIPVALTYHYPVADDSMRDQISTDGDNILVTGTNPNTGQTKSATFDISGGCNCHVQKISGQDTIRFDQ